MTRILIVEDEPNMVAGLRDNFEFEGYDVITAPDGVAGLERALSEAPDLVILDVMMPRMSGLDVCKHSKPNGPRCRSSCSRRVARRWTKSSDWNWARMTTSLSRFPSASCWPGSGSSPPRQDSAQGTGALFVWRGRGKSEKLPGFAQWQGHGLFIQGIRSAQIFPVPSRRDVEP